jgi:hypothetical protein
MEERDGGAAVSRRKMASPEPVSEPPAVEVANKPWLASSPAPSRIERSDGLGGIELDDGADGASEGRKGSLKFCAELERSLTMSVSRRKGDCWKGWDVVAAAGQRGLGALPKLPVSKGSVVAVKMEKLLN